MLREHEPGIRDGAAERSGMQIALRAAQVDLKIREAAQAVADRRNAAIEHRRVGDDDDVGREFLLVRSHEVVEVDAADFFLALDEELDVERQAAVLLQCASTALMCMKTWPLSSAAPRA